MFFRFRDSYVPGIVGGVYLTMAEDLCTSAHNYCNKDPEKT